MIRPGGRTTQFALQSVLTVAAVLALFPFIWMLVVSIKPPAEVFQAIPSLIPQAPTLSNYITALTTAPLLRFLLNGLVVCSLVLLGQLLVVVPAGYAFARLEFRYREPLFALVLAALVVPGYVTAIPNFMLLSKLGWLNTNAALTVPFLASAFGIFLFRQFFWQLPREIEEAARIDGCGTFGVIRHVVLPLSRPALASFAVFSVVAHWNDFFWPLIVMRDVDRLTPPAGIAFFALSDGGANWGVVMAAATIVMLPLLIGFLLARKQFIASIAMTGVKG